MTKLIWKLYNSKKITLEVAVELLSKYDRKNDHGYITKHK